MVYLLKKWLSPRRPAPPVAIELKRDGLYVIECAEPLTAERLSDMETYLAKFHEKTGCEFLILDHGLRIAVTGEPE